MSAPVLELFDPRLAALQRLAVAIDRMSNEQVKDQLHHVRLWLECACECKTTPVARAILGIES